MKRIEVYTDGACSGNPGPGGWGVMLCHEDGTRREASGGEKNTTNQRMELVAAIKALELIPGDCTQVSLHTDSSYLANCFKDKWYVNWERNGWKNVKGKPVANADLWRRLLELVSTPGRTVTFVKVAGHADDARNNRCDELARAAIRTLG